MAHAAARTTLYERKLGSLGSKRDDTPPKEVEKQETTGVYKLNQYGNRYSLNT